MGCGIPLLWIEAYFPVTSFGKCVFLNLSSLKLKNSYDIPRMRLAFLALLNPNILQSTSNLSFRKAAYFQINLVNSFQMNLVRNFPPLKRN